MHSDENCFKCDHCNYSTYAMSTLRSHRLEHSVEKPFQCDMCNRCFKTKPNLTEHQVQHSGVKNFKCDKCTYSSYRMYNLTIHRRTHNTDKPFKCDLCNFSASVKLSFKKHQLQHTRKIKESDKGSKLNIYKCNKCNYLCTKKLCLTKHQLKYRHQSSLEKSFKCDLCDYSCSLQTNLNEHVKTHLKKLSIVLYNCSSALTCKTNRNENVQTHSREKTDDLSNYLRSLETNLSKHQQTRSSEKSFKCDICNYSCSCEASLNEHRQSHSFYERNVNSLEKNLNSLETSLFSLEERINERLQQHSSEKSFECDLCDFSCSLETSLKEHRKTHSSDNSDLYNDPCLLQTSLNSLETSLNVLETNLNEHLIEKTFKCHLCAYSCLLKTSLKEHLRTHLPKKIYKCHLCDHSCSLRKSLMEHQQSQHPSDKIFKCEFCDYSSMFELSLTLHLRSHSHRNPFRCDQCDFSFSAKQILRRHQRMHSNKPLKCNMCDYCCYEVFRLKQHQKIHLGETPFSCDECSLSSSGKVNPGKHLMTCRRANENPLYKCSECNYFSTRKSSLISHQREKHSNRTRRSPFQCAQCQLTCANNKAFITHLQTHIEEVQFKCSKCVFKSNQMKNLRQHQLAGSCPGHKQNEKDNHSMSTILVNNVRPIMPKVNTGIDSITSSVTVPHNPNKIVTNPEMSQEPNRGFGNITQIPTFPSEKPCPVVLKQHVEFNHPQVLVNPDNSLLYNQLVFIVQGPNRAFTNVPPHSGQATCNFFPIVSNQNLDASRIQLNPVTNSLQQVTWFVPEPIRKFENVTPTVLPQNQLPVALEQRTCNDSTKVPFPYHEIKTELNPTFSNHLPIEQEPNRVFESVQPFSEQITSVITTEQSTNQTGIEFAPHQVKIENASPFYNHKLEDFEPYSERTYDISSQINDGQSMPLHVGDYNAITIKTEPEWLDSMEMHVNAELSVDDHVDIDTSNLFSPKNQLKIETCTSTTSAHNQEVSDGIATSNSSFYECVIKNELDSMDLAKLDHNLSLNACVNLIKTETIENETASQNICVKRALPPESDRNGGDIVNTLDFCDIRPETLNSSLHQVYSFGLLNNGSDSRFF